MTSSPTLPAHRVRLLVPAVLLPAGVALSVGLATTTAAAQQASAPSVRFELAGAPTPVGPMAGLPQIADLDGDGALDVVVACGPCCGMEPDPAAGHVRVLLGDGRGGLRPQDRIRVGDTALRVAIGDIDEDGHPDVACVQHSSYRVELLRGSADGTLQHRPEWGFDWWDGERPHVHSVVLEDLDRDGHLDLAATLVADHSLAVWLGDGRGGFRPALGQPYYAHRHPYEQLAIADLNEDGNPDAVLTDVRGGGVTVLAGSGTGMFATSRGFRLAAHTPIDVERPTALALGDLDGDGDADAVAVIDEAPQAVVLQNQGGGDFAPLGPPLRLAVAANSVRVADLNGDGHPDFVTGCVQGTALSVNYGDGAGGFAPSLAVDVGVANPSVAVGDLDGDGHVDLVASSYSEGVVVVLLARRQ